jgi:hypothetical protein
VIGGFVPEWAGLKVLVSNAVESGTLHAITPPPERGDYPTRERYEKAYAEWERMGLWTVKNIGTS